MNTSQKQKNFCFIFCVLKFLGEKLFFKKKVCKCVILFLSTVWASHLACDVVESSEIELLSTEGACEARTVETVAFVRDKLFAGTDLGLAAIAAVKHIRRASTVFAIGHFALVEELHAQLCFALCAFEVIEVPVFAEGTDFLLSCVDFIAATCAHRCCHTMTVKLATFCVDQILALQLLIAIDARKLSGNAIGTQSATVGFVEFTTDLLAAICTGNALWMELSAKCQYMFETKFAATLCATAR